MIDFIVAQQFSNQFSSEYKTILSIRSYSGSSHYSRLNAFFTFF